MTVVAWVGARHRVPRRHGRARAARHQTRARLLDHQPARLHVPRARRRRVRRRDLPGDRHAFFKATLFLGAGTVIHGNARQPGHADHGSLPQVHAVHRDRVRDRVARHRRRAAVRRASGRRTRSSRRRSRPTTTACGSSALLAAILTGVVHDPPGLPHLLRQRAVRGDGRGGGRATPNRERHRRRRCARRHQRPGHADRRATAIRRARRCCTTTPTRATDSWSSPVVLLAGLAVDRRAARPARSSASSGSTSGSSRCSPTRTTRSRHRRSSAGSACRSWRSSWRLIGLGAGLRALPARPRVGRPGSVRRAARASSAGCSATPTTTTTASRELVDGPLRGFAGWLARVFDAKIIDGAVNGVGLARARDRARLPPAAERLRAQLRARHRARHGRAARCTS